MAMYKFSLGTTECCLRMFIKVSKPLFYSQALLRPLSGPLSLRHGYLLVCGYFDLIIPISHTGNQPPWYVKWWFFTRCRCRSRCRFRSRDTFRGTFWSWCLGMIRGRGRIWSMDTFLFVSLECSFLWFICLRCWCSEHLSYSLHFRHHIRLSAGRLCLWYCSLYASVNLSLCAF